MTDPSSGDDGTHAVAAERCGDRQRPLLGGPTGTPRVVVFVAHDENRRLLAEWLATDYDVVTASSPDDLDGSFDLAVVDRVALAHHEEPLMERKRRERPVLLPFLFVVSQQELDRLGPGVWEQIDGVVRERVDELITTPIKKAELEGRLSNLLNSRELSLRLRDQREQYRRLLSVAPETITTVDSDGTVRYLNSRGAELFGVDDPEALYGESLFDAIHEADREAVRSLVGGVGDSDECAPGEATGDDGPRGAIEARVVTDGEVSHAELIAAAITYDRRPAVQLVVRDVTERHLREQEITRQRDALRTLDRLNALIRDIDQGLVRATDRAEIEHTVCDRLVGSGRYVAAWIGTDSATRHAVTPHAATGAADDYLDEVVISTGGGDGVRDPVGQALATRSVVVVDDLQATEGGRWQAAAAAQGFGAAIAVPLTYEDTQYGALGLFADRPGAFEDADEVSVLEELGETIGHAVNAAESRRALLADRVVELEFAIDQPDSALHHISADIDCQFRLEGVVAATNGSFLEYFAVVDCDPEAVLEQAETEPAISYARFVGEHGGEALFEFVFDEEQVVQAFGRLGARVVDLVVEDGRYEVTVELPFESDIHAITTGLQERYEAASLLAQRETEHALTSRHELWASFQERLTDRQWEVVQTAFFAGFFDWPRSSTGEEVAESLDVSPSTFHEHLRAAERKLLEALLEG
ncbi:bacterio-opsin activator domain-containing protein [Halomarina litorea]|uniref:bacterio-opsin activator domain-containing protein n=1 Tax=Halomarina litorea TaxID=2961595 RepID=UPI0020C3D243|nr:bacterio-opsin activator domain-containing protein [Halomarina sp. BCD28]